MNRIAASTLSALIALALVGCGDDAQHVKTANGAFCHGEEDGTLCDDGNGCTEDDRCGLGICKGAPIEDGTECEDGTLCTVGDQCLAGQCLGEITSCASLDGPCAVGACDPATGTCEAQSANGGDSCDDGSLCTVEDHCDAGGCVGAAVDCSDPSMPCSAGFCNPTSGECEYVPAPSGDDCDDANPCTVDDRCEDDQCVGDPLDCSGLTTPCQNGVCDAQSGLCTVEPFPSGTVCDDGNPCTDGETCHLGNCGGGVQVPDGNLCDDGDKCTVGETCLAGECITSPKDCSEISNSACIEGVCNPETGECEGVPVEDPACSCWESPDGDSCDDGLACTVDDTCSDQLCVGAILDCSQFGDTCNDGVCNPSSGKCTKSPDNDGGECDDDLDCTDTDVCLAGVCAGAIVDCSHLDGPCSIGVCAEESGECTAVISTDGTTCDDGDVCTGNDHCEDGNCTWGFDLCDACVGEEVGAPCEEGNACTLSSTCKVTVGKLVCLGDALKCPDMGPCMFGMCDTDTGECIPKPLPDGLFCFDQDPCTVADICESGECQGIPKECSQGDLPCATGTCQPITGVCQLEPAADDEDCDDGDLCTTDDACNAGLCVGMSKECQSQGDDACMSAECNPETGDCGVPLEDGTECDDLDVCTAGDTCQGGVCEGTDVCFCMDKLDGEPCDDGYKCTQDDACNGGGCTGQPKDCSFADSVCNLGVCDPADGECIPVPMQDSSPCDDDNACTVQDGCDGGTCTGSAKDCSSLDTQCGTGICAGANGACEFAPGQDGILCDDKEFCTSGDTCQAGVCAGDVDLCATCKGKHPDDPCEDGDPCTQDGKCLETSGMLVCVGEATDCSEMDSDCGIGICDPETGDCAASPKPDGLACDDGAPCTQEDGCVDGTCAGTDIDMCGEVPLQCEGPEPNEKMNDAILLPASDPAVTVLGWINPAGETDWYSVPVEAGQLVTVLAHSHCDSELDTQIGIYYPDGLTTLAVADDGGDGGWSFVDAAEAEESGLFLIGLTAFSASGNGSYFLDVTVATPPPCLDDAECGCEQLACVFDGPQAGLCVPDMGLEAEPNDAPPQATPIALETSLKAEFSSEVDQDWYVVELQPDIPVTLETSSFCDGQTDPKLWLYGELGMNVLASDADSAGQGHARISKFHAPKSGNYRIRVQDEGATAGAYVLTALDGRCKADADCDCVDQKCKGSPDAPGKCVPLFTVPETGDDAEPAPLILGKRVHAELEAPYDVDSFIVSLAPGKYDFETLSYCGLETDTHLVVLSPSGEALGEDEDSGDGFFAALPGITASEMGVYAVIVTGYGPSVGEYVVKVSYAQADDD